MSKKVNAALKKAYYYFGFKKVVSYDEVEENIEILKNNTSDEAVLNKIEGHETEIKEFWLNKTIPKRDNANVFNVEIYTFRIEILTK